MNLYSKSDAVLLGIIGSAILAGMTLLGPTGKAEETEIEKAIQETRRAELALDVKLAKLAVKKAEVALADAQSMHAAAAQDDTLSALKTEYALKKARVTLDGARAELVIAESKLRHDTSVSVEGATNVEDSESEKAAEIIGLDRGEPIYNDRLKRFKFHLEKVQVTSGAETAQIFWVYYRGNGYPTITGVWGDPRTNSLVVVGPPEADQPIRDTIAQWEASETTGIDLDDDSLEARQRQLQGRRRSAVEQIASRKLEIIEAEAAGEKPDGEQLTELNRKLTDELAELDTINRQLKVISDSIKAAEKIPGTVKPSERQDADIGSSPRSETGSAKQALELIELVTRGGEPWVAATNYLETETRRLFKKSVTAGFTATELPPSPQHPDVPIMLRLMLPHVSQGGSEFVASNSMKMWVSDEELAGGAAGKRFVRAFYWPKDAPKSDNSQLLKATTLDANENQAEWLAETEKLGELIAVIEITRGRPAEPAKPEASAADRLQGIWLLEREEQFGGTTAAIATDSELARLVVEGRTLRGCFDAPWKPLDWTIEFDRETDPQLMYLTTKVNDRQKKRSVRFRFQDDALELCFNRRRPERLPVEFRTAKGADAIIWRLRRAEVHSSSTPPDSEPSADGICKGIGHPLVRPCCRPTDEHSTGWDRDEKYFANK